MEETKKQKITVQTTVNAPIEKVWDYWTGARHIEKWNSPSEDWHTPKASNDVRVGGKFSSTMAARDGSMSFDFEGQYTAVEQNRKLEYTIVDGRTVSVIFEPTHKGIDIIETFEAENQNPIEMQRGGWQAIMDSFKKYTESN